MDFLKVALTSELVDEAKRELMKTLWDRDKSYSPSSLESFFKYYSIQTYHTCNDNGRFMESRTHRHVFDVVERIRAGQTWADIRKDLKKDHQDAEGDLETGVDGLINLAARILSMLDVGRAGASQSGRKVLLWKDYHTLSLKDVLVGYFDGQKQAPASTSPRLTELFNARKLRKLGGIKIEWTSNLAEHLLLIENDSKVVIFHHATFLKVMDASASPLLPKELLRETLDTLALLFPQNDSKLVQWYRKIKRTELFSQCLDHEATHCGYLELEHHNIEHFRYWKHRLAILAQAFENAEPKGLEQWWHDRRKRVQWSTFWVAVTVLVLTIFFGLVQSIEGALQVYKAYHPT